MLVFLRVCPDTQGAPESQESQEPRSDNISNHSSMCDGVTTVLCSLKVP